MKETGILPSIALDRINRGVVTNVEMIDASRMLIVSSSGAFIVEVGMNTSGCHSLFFSETERPAPKE